MEALFNLALVITVIGAVFTLMAAIADYVVDPWLRRKDEKGR